MTRLLIRPRAFLVYLLHIEPPVARARHYMGICRHDRLKARLKEHAGGHGARLTGEAVERGSSLFFVCAEYVSSPDHERVLKQRGHYRRLCWLCSGEVDEADSLAQLFRLVTSRAACTWTPKGW